MTIQSGSVFDAPIVSPNWMLENTNLEVAVAAFKRAREAWKVIEKEVSIGPEIVCVFPITTKYIVQAKKSRSAEEVLSDFLG